MLRALSSRTASCSYAQPRGARRAPRGRRTAVAATALLKVAPDLSDKVAWSQTTDDVLLRVPVPEGVRGRDVALELHPKRLKLGRRGGGVWVEGSLADAGEVRVDDSFWTLETDPADGTRYVALTLAKAAMGYMSWEALLEADRPDTTITTRLGLRISIGGEHVGAIAVGLYGRVVPRTAENFRELALGSRGVSPLSGKPLSYKGCAFNRIIPGFMVQGGDFTAGDGTGGESIYGERFPDENFRLRHERAGLLAMANAGPDTNGSQFYITLAPQPHLDGKHVVFGIVEAGMEVVRIMENEGSQSGAVARPVVIEACEELPLGPDALDKVAEENKRTRLARA